MTTQQQNQIPLRLSAIRLSARKTLSALQNLEFAAERLLLGLGGDLQRLNATQADIAELARAIRLACENRPLTRMTDPNVSPNGTSQLIDDTVPAVRTLCDAVESVAGQAAAAISTLEQYRLQRISLHFQDPRGFADGALIFKYAAEAEEAAGATIHSIRDWTKAQDTLVRMCRQTREHLEQIRSFGRGAVGPRHDRRQRRSTEMNLPSQNRLSQLLSEVTAVGASLDRALVEVQGAQTLAELHVLKDEWQASNGEQMQGEAVKSRSNGVASDLSVVQLRRRCERQKLILQQNISRFRGLGDEMLSWLERAKTGGLRINERALALQQLPALRTNKTSIDAMAVRAQQQLTRAAEADRALQPLWNGIARIRPQTMRVSERIAVLESSLRSLAEQLKAALDGTKKDGSAAHRQQIVHLADQRIQHLGEMARGLRVSFERVQSVMEECERPWRQQYARHREMLQAQIQSGRDLARVSLGAAAQDQLVLVRIAVLAARLADQAEKAQQRWLADDTIEQATEVAIADVGQIATSLQQLGPQLDAARRKLHAGPASAPKETTVSGRLIKNAVDQGRA